MDKAAKVKHVKSAVQSRDHVCHWPGCGKQCKPANMNMNLYFAYFWVI